MATFGELQTEIAQKLDQDYLALQISTAINRTITYLQPFHFWFNTATSAITLNTNDPIVPDIPSDFQYEFTSGGLVIVNSQMRYPLQKLHEVQYDLANVNGQGLPYIYCNRNGNLEVYYYPDQEYTLNLYYVKKYADLVNSNDTNDWTNNAVRLIVAQTLADLYLDQRKSKDDYSFYKGVAQDELSDLQRRNKRRISTGQLVTDSFLTRSTDGYYPYYHY